MVKDKYNQAQYLGFVEKYLPPIIFWTFIIVISVVIYNYEFITNLLGVYSVFVLVPVLLLSVAVVYGLIASWRQKSPYDDDYSI